MNWSLDSGSLVEIMLLGLGVVVISSFIALFNGLVKRRNRVQTAWADIDAQLKRRHDLIPNLVNAARGYMEHERSTLEAVAAARAQALSAGSNVMARASAEAGLTLALSQLCVHVERYPALRATENMQLLMEQLTSTENRIAFARQFYDEKVMEYNGALQSFPRNLVAGALGFVPAVFFRAEAADRVAAQVEVE